MNEGNNFHQLQQGTILNSKYRIEKVLGEGGFGITYLATDTSLDINVAIKEYFPAGFVTRESNFSNTVSFFSGNKKDVFISGKEKFIQEARVLGKLSHLPGIVSIRDYFQENNTAYIVMEYLNGITLKDYLIQQGGMLSVEHTLQLLQPVLLSLAEVHNQGLIHRDISPDNIMLLPNNQVKLLDFGAARNVENADAKSLSVLLKPGYAPEEQYRSRGIQGSWTDVYAFCATIYKCITGTLPQESLERILEDELIPPSAMGINISPDIESILLHGLAVLKENRIESATALYSALYLDGKDTKKTVQTNKRKKAPIIALSIIIITLVAVSAILISKFLTKETISGPVSLMNYSSSIADCQDTTTYIRQRDGITLGDTDETFNISNPYTLLSAIQSGNLMLYTDGCAYLVFPGTGLISFDYKTAGNLNYIVEYDVENNFTIYDDKLYYIKSSNGFLHSVNTDGSKDTELISYPISSDNFVILEDYICYYTTEGKNGSGLYLYQPSKETTTLIAKASDTGNLISLTCNEKQIICVNDNRDIVLVDINENSIYTTSCVNVNPDSRICQTADTYNKGFFFLGKDNKTIYYYNIKNDSMEDIYSCSENIILMDYCDESIYFVTESGIYYRYVENDFIPLDGGLNYYTTN